MNISKSICSIVVIISVFTSVRCSAASDAAPQSAGASSTFDSVIEQQMSEVGIMGLAAAIIVDKQVVWMKGYGFADKQREAPFTPDTVMKVASIAKPFTGVAMMRAVHDGKLSLDEDINKYLPFRVVNPHYPKEKITLRHLATHSSSITDRWEAYGSTYHYGGDSPEPLGSFLKDYFALDGKHYSSDNFLDAKPGSQRDYSNIGAGLAGFIVERAVGEPLNVYTRTHIFKPLQMNRSGWFLSEVDPKNLSTLYVAQDGFSIPIQYYGDTTYPGGGLLTSVADLSKFFIALLSGGEYQGSRILDADSTEEMLRFQFNDANRLENFPAADGNSGLFWRTKYNGTLIGHGGNDPGVQTVMLSDLSKEVGVILFLNTSLSEADQGASEKIFGALWKHAASLKKPTKATTE